MTFEDEPTYIYQTASSGAYYCQQCGGVAVYSPTLHSQWHKESDNK